MTRSPLPGHTAGDPWIEVAERDLHDSFEEECGVFGVFGHADAVHLTRDSLIALQHRGQESAGIAVVDAAGALHCVRGMGLVSEALDEPAIGKLFGGARRPISVHAAPGAIEGVSGHVAPRDAIGHVRYSTTGASLLANAQPLQFSLRGGEIALAHNGNLVNAGSLRDELERGGAIFQTTSDTEVVAHLVARSGAAELGDAIREAIAAITGGFAMCVLTDDRMIAVRDPRGLRPLVLGRLDGAWCVASESCAFDSIGADVRARHRSRRAGRGDGRRARQRAARYEDAQCVVQLRAHLLRAARQRRRRPERARGAQAHRQAARARVGGRCRRRHRRARLVDLRGDRFCGGDGHPVRDRPRQEPLRRAHVHRTEPEQRTRGVRLKLSAVRGVVAGKRVVMIDDSLVRGTTSRRIVGLLREAGATEVHVRIASPPVRFPCYFGIDTSAQDELVASTHDRGADPRADRRRLARVPGRASDDGGLRRRAGRAARALQRMLHRHATRRRSDEVPAGSP